MKTAIIDVGGGLRGIYTCGIFDFLLDNNINFDVAIGVSAGSANLASYISKQRGRNYIFYTEYAFRRKYMSLSNFIFKGSFVDLDYIYSKLSNSSGENPLDYDTFSLNPTEFFVVASNAITGKVHYFTKEDIKKDQYDVFKASSAIPYVCKPYIISNTPFYDGAVCDPIPLEKAIDLKCDKIVLLLTRPINLLRDANSDIKLAKK